MAIGARTVTPPLSDSSSAIPVAALTVAGADRQVTVLYADGVRLQIGQRWFAEATEAATLLETASHGPARELHLPSMGIAWTERDTATACRFESSWRQSAGHLEFSVRLSNTGSAAVALRLEQSLAGLPLRGTCFAPSLQSEYDLTASGVAFAYRGAPGLPPGLPGGALAIPMVCFYERDRDLGFTVAAHIDAPTPPFACTAQADRVTVQRRVRLPAGGAVTLRHVVLRHEGCWRPGLRWVRDTYPQYFMVSAETVAATHGCFVYSNTADPALCDELARQGVKNVEIHWTCPFFGKSVPEEDPWVKMLDDKWNTIKRTTDPKAPREDAPAEEIKRYVARVTTPSGRVEEVQRFIRDLQARGMQAYLYLNPTECWEFFAVQEFPENILRHPDGTPRMTWFDHVQMDCRPDSRWGQYLCTEVERLLELYPEADGVFMDQSAADPDDGRVCGITTALARIVGQAGKTCYWNGPYMVDLLPHTVGLLGELGPLQGERIKWLTVGNKVCCGLGHTEAQYQRNLLNGLWPPAPSLIHARSSRVSDVPARPQPIPAELERLHRRYLALYERFAGKTWFLGPNPLDVPDGVQGNIFVAQTGAYLIPLIVPGHESAMGVAIRDVTVAIRVPDAERLRAAHVRLASLPGQRYLIPLQRRDGELRVTLPWLGSACLLELSQDEPVGEPLPEAGTEMPSGPPRPRRVICTVIHAEGVAPEGNADSLRNGLTTRAPLPPVPTRRAYLNGLEIGALGSANSWHWHPLVGVGVVHNVTVDITDILRLENELVIAPAGPQDFFKLRRISMLVVFSDGRVCHSKVERQTYSSCAHPQAEGVVQSPLRIPLVFAELPR